MAQLIRFCLQHYLITLALITSTAALFLVLEFTKKEVFESDATILLNVSNSSVVVPLINSLNKSAISSLSKPLNIKENQLSALKKIEAFYLVDITGNGQADLIDLKTDINYLDENITKIEYLVHIKIAVLDTALIPHLNMKLLNIFSHPPFPTLQTERLSRLNNMLAQYKSEYQKLHDHQMLQYATPPNQQGSININIYKDTEDSKASPANLYHDQMLSLKSEINIIENAILHRTEQAEFLQSFFMPRNPKSSLLMHLFISVIVFSISLLVAFYSKKKIR